MKNQLETDCLQIEDSAESHAKWLHEWLLRHPNVGKGAIPRCIIVAAAIIAVAVIVAAFIMRPSGARFVGIGGNRVLDTQTGDVKWADPPER